MKKGFTLIELLAVIVILAIIALIAVPIVLNIIDETKENASLRSAEMYLDAVEMSIAKKTMTTGIPNGSYNVLSNGNICLNYDVENKCTEELVVEVDGEVPDSGIITITSGKITAIELKYEQKTIVKNDKNQLEIKKEQSNKNGTFAATIIKHAKDNNYYYTESPDFNKLIQEGEFGLYQAPDDYGTSYYFRGDVENNYVELGEWLENSDKPYWVNGPGAAYHKSLEECEMDTNHTIYGQECIKVGALKGEPMYWRIVRINGDGTIRLVYDGTEKIENGTSHNTLVANTIYGVYYDGRNVGYTYDGGNGNQIDSEIKGAVDEWYTVHLEQDYGKYIADSIFCNHREIGSEIYWGVDGLPVETESEASTIDTYYVKSKKLTCKNQNDRYTVTDTIKGNGYLTNPIGLLNAAEVYLAGESYSYLRSGDSYWLSSPDNLLEGSGGIMYNYFVNDNGYISSTTSTDYYDYNPTEWIGARPAINLKADVEFTGLGTIDDPYVIITE